MKAAKQQHYSLYISGSSGAMHCSFPRHGSQKKSRRSNDLQDLK